MLQFGDVGDPPPSREKQSHGRKLLAHYGDCVAVYQGEGVVKLEAGQELQCAFEVGQLPQGNIFLLCTFHPPYPDLLASGGAVPLIRPVQFSGATDRGYRVMSDGPIANSNYLPTERGREGWWE